MRILTVRKQLSDVRRELADAKVELHKLKRASEDRDNFMVTIAVELDVNFNAADKSHSTAYITGDDILKRIQEIRWAHASIAKALEQLKA